MFRPSAFFAAIATIWIGSIAGALGDSPSAGQWTLPGNGPGHASYYPKTIGPAEFTPGWTAERAKPVSQLLIVADTVYGTTSEELFALNAADGTTRWSLPLGKPLTLSPASYADGRLYLERVDDHEKQLLCVDAASGRLLWSAPQESNWVKYSAPTVADGRVFAGKAGFGGISVHDAVTGAPLYSWKGLGSDDYWPRTYADGIIYSCQGSLGANDAATGASLWSLFIGHGYNASESSFAVVGQGVAATYNTGYLTVVDLATKSVRWDVREGGRDPVIANGAVFAKVGNGMRAYDIWTGAVLGTYDLTDFPSDNYAARLPLVTDDLVIVPTGAGIVIFDRATFAFRQKLDVRGGLSYAAGLLCVAVVSDYGATSKIATFNVQTAEADPTPAPLPPPSDPLARPNTDRALADTSAAWIDAARRGDEVYFLFDAPAKIERYRLSVGQWLAPISLPDGPTAFRATDEGICVAFGNRVSRFSLDGTTEMPLAVTPYATAAIFAAAGNLWLIDPTNTNATVLDSGSGRIFAMTEFGLPMSGAVFGEATNRLFGLLTYPRSVELRSDGTLVKWGYSSNESSSANRLVLFPREGRIAATDGKLFASGDLEFLGELGEGFVDLDFVGETSVALKGSELVVRSATLKTVGRVSLATPATRVFAEGTSAITFSAKAGRGVEAATTSIATLLAAADTLPIDPTALAYLPDDIEFDGVDTVYLLSRLHQSVFRWSVAQRRYLTSISLADVPQHLAYSATSRRLYLSYASGRIGKVDPATSLAETDFATLSSAPLQIETAGEFLVIGGIDTDWGARLVYGPDGDQRSAQADDYRSREFIWNAQRRQLYYASDGWSHVDLITESIDAGGIVGRPSYPFRFDYESKSYPIRVAPDASMVLTGGGAFFDGTTLRLAGNLGTTIADAVWMNGDLFTVTGIVPFGGDSPTTGKLQAWNQSRTSTASLVTIGAPLRLFALDHSLLLITRVGASVRFETHAADLAQLTSDPGNNPPPLVGLQPRANPPRVLADTASPWLDAVSANGIAYFLFDAPAKIERYDMARLLWLQPIPLPAPPIGFAASADGIFVSFGKAVSIFSLDGLTETPIFLAGVDLSQVFAHGPTLYAIRSYPADAAAIDIATGALRGVIALDDFLTGISFSPAQSRFVGIEAHIPSTLVSIPVGPGGATGPATTRRLDFSVDSYRTRSFLSPAGDRLIDTDGDVFDSFSFDFLGNIGRAFTDLCFVGEEPLVLRDQTLIRYSQNQKIRSWFLLPGEAQRVFTHQDTAFAFSTQTGRGVVATAVPLVSFHHGAVASRVRGTFSGIFGDGMITANLLTNGALSGVVRLPLRSGAFRAVLDNEDSATVTVNVGGTNVRLEITLNSDGPAPQLQVYVTLAADDQWLGYAEALMSKPRVPSEASPFAGTYTCLASNSSFDTASFYPDVPPVCGYGRMVVSRTGQVTFVGLMADGRRVSSGSAVNTDGQSLIFCATGRNTVTLSGAISFTPTAATDCSGSLYWYKPEKPKAAFYPNFIISSIDFAASRYKPRASMLDVDLTSATANVAISFLGGNLRSGVREELALRRANTFGLPPVASRLLDNLRIDPLTGFISGAVRKPLNKKGPLAGVIFQKSNAAFGHFVGLDEYGAFRLDALGEKAAPAEQASPTPLLRRLHEVVSPSR